LNCPNPVYLIAVESSGGRIAVGQPIAGVPFEVPCTPLTNDGF